jgi:hypothetical protein
MKNFLVVSKISRNVMLQYQLSIFHDWCGPYGIVLNDKVGILRGPGAVCEIAISIESQTNVELPKIYSLAIRS